MTNETQTQSSLDNILDEVLDDLADLPSISLFPNGAHKVTISFTTDDKKGSVMLQMTYIEPLELSDPTATAPSPGDKNSVFFNLKKKDGTPNTYAQGALKNILGSLKNLGGSTSREIMESAANAEVAVVTKIRVGKGEYEGKDNLDVVKLELM
jgi:hypothetical protein